MPTLKRKVGRPPKKTSPKKTSPKKTSPKKASPKKVNRQKGGIRTKKIYYLESPETDFKLKHYEEIRDILSEILCFIGDYNQSIKYYNIEPTTYNETYDEVPITDVICEELKKLRKDNMIRELYKFDGLYKEFCQMRKLLKKINLPCFDKYLDYFERCDQIADTKSFAKSFVKAHASKTHPLISRLPRELLGEMSQYIVPPKLSPPKKVSPRKKKSMSDSDSE